MADLSHLERALRAVLWHLREHLTDLVLIGGWVPLLYRRTGRVREVERERRQGVGQW